MAKVVQAADYRGWSMSVMQMFGQGPKFQVRCGECGSVFSGRIEMVDRPRLKCPLCGVINELPLRVR